MGTWCDTIPFFMQKLAVVIQKDSSAVTLSSKMSSSFASWIITKLQLKKSVMGDDF